MKTKAKGLSEGHHAQNESFRRQQHCSCVALVCYATFLLLIRKIRQFQENLLSSFNTIRHGTQSTEEGKCLRSDAECSETEEENRKQ